MMPKTLHAPILLIRSLCLATAAMLAFQLFYLGAQPEAAGLIPAPWDKLAHFGYYSVLTALLWVGTAGRMPLAVILSVTAIGALDELNQANLPGRSADAWDFFTNVLAAGVTSFVLLVLYGAGDRRRPR